jgi:recombination protein RecR
LITYSSKLLEQAVNELARLPGIGRKTALRLALHLLRQDVQTVEALGQAVIRMRQEIIYCASCHNISDEEFCTICSNPQRDHTIVCIVEDIRDVMAIEKTNQFNGVYHVLGGVISPIEGIGPGDLTVGSLMTRLEATEITEIILALPTTIEGDTTSFYISRKIDSAKIKLTAIARGISIGDELEYTDELTLGRSILNRTPYLAMSMPGSKRN